MDFPEPLYESCLLPRRKLCLVCGKKMAVSVLRNMDRDVCPLCVDCAADWNMYGYRILKRIQPGTLLKNIALFKLGHWLQPPLRTIVGDMASFRRWAEHMRNFRHLL